MAFMAVLEADLRALSTEARRRYPVVKEGAEHAIRKLRLLSSPAEIAQNDDILKIFLMACEVKTVKMSTIGLSCLQKLISHDAVVPSALKEILSTLKDHAEMADDIVQLKTLQTILIIFQSRLHPENEDNMAQALGICLLLLENNRSSDSVRNTAAATFRQAVALIFDHVIAAESLPAGKAGAGSHSSRSNSVTGDLSRSINRAESLENDFPSGGPLPVRDSLTKAGKIGLRLLEDLTALAAGGSATWLRINSLQRTFVLDILEFILSNYVAIFRTLVPYEQVLRHQICSLLMTSLRTNAELEGEAGEPSFRRLVLRSVAHVIRLYSSSLVTECEVFLSMLVKVTFLDSRLWHRILVLEVLRGFCVEVRTLSLLFQNFDMNPKNTNVVEGMTKALARVVSSIQIPDTSEESLAAVAGMFSSKAKGIEWSLDNDASNAAVMVASEAHAITLAVEGLLGVIFTVATLTDEAVDVGELESPRCDSEPPFKCTGETAVLCTAMVDSMWLTILDALSLILTRSQGEAIILEILKGYQAFTQACGVLHAVEPLNSFLASLCKFTISMPIEAEKRSSVLQSPGSRRAEHSIDLRDSVVLTPKNVQALRTLFNISHRLHNMLGPSWILVLETLAALDRAIHSPHATTQEVSASVPRLTRESSGQYSDFSILSSLNSQLFESSAMMHISAVKSLLSALRQLSNQCMPGNSSNPVQTSSQHIGSITFSVEKMISILTNNMHRVEPLWDQVVGHLLELADNSSHHLRNLALEALDQSICSVLGSDKFQGSRFRHPNKEMDITSTESNSFEYAVISPLRVLYFSTENLDVRAGSLKILLHVLERHGDKLYYSWLAILQTLRSVADASERDLIPLGFQSIRVIMNDGLATIPVHWLDICIEVTGAYSAQLTELNISLTAIGLLWTTTDFIAKGLPHGNPEHKETGSIDGHAIKHKGDEKMDEDVEDKIHQRFPLVRTSDREKLLFSVFSLLQKLGADERPEVRNSSIRTLFQTLGTHGQKLSRRMWEDCLWNYVFPTLDHVSHMAAHSSTDEWQGKELGVRGGKAIHMLIHHSRNTAQKQWDETIVLVLGGIARILRSFFPFLKNLSNFWTGWESLLLFVRNSILNGSKEVALAAISCLQTTVVSHSPKGNMPMPYLKSVLDVYELVLQRGPNCSAIAASKVKQEILQSLGELFVQTQKMFDDDLYLQLLKIIHLAVRQPKSTSDSSEADTGHIPPVQRTMLEVLPQLRPSDHLSSMWSHLLRELLRHLPGSDVLLADQENEAEVDKHKPGNGKMALHVDLVSPVDRQKLEGSPMTPTKTQKMGKSEFPNGVATASQSPKSGSATTKSGPPSITNHLFAEKLVPVLVDLFVSAPRVEKYNIFPEIIQGFGRCMATRRDNPDGALWRLSVEGFNRILVDDVSRTSADGLQDPIIARPSRTRLWKEVADVYEIFLVGSCGRALPSKVISSATQKADETLEMTILDVLGDNILSEQSDAPDDILLRLISALDRCASRTCCLPVETVELMPSHCSKFSLTCLQKLFLLCRYSNKANVWSAARSRVSRISISVLTKRCEFILDKFLIDEKDLGERLLPALRIEEIVYVLEELSHLIIHIETASTLPLRPYLIEGLPRIENYGSRAHLLVLFPSLCELVISRETRVRELVRVLLRLISSELEVQKVSLA
ncbi:protein MON2 homolog isoform X1 [Papaver somniferum]|uniref:protein MON2 homolog isoform X1 n=1 Tax=Papaver somniferum TaxID=3469 RepID=UPI000E6F4B57|nr:protein MON2 homolog isoform X1 [Papaver somniferum]